MGAIKRAVSFDSKYLVETIKKNDFINHASVVAGYGHAPTFRQVLRKGEMPIERLIKLIKRYSLNTDELFSKTEDEIVLLLTSRKGEKENV